MPVNYSALQSLSILLNPLTISTTPRPPSSLSRSPGATARQIPAQLTTAGRPASRRRIEAWLSSPPISATTPATLGKITAQEGSRAGTTRMVRPQLAGPAQEGDEVVRLHGPPLHHGGAEGDPREDPPAL